MGTDVMPREVAFTVDGGTDPDWSGRDANVESYFCYKIVVRSKLDKMLILEGYWRQLRSTAVISYAEEDAHRSLN